jgi:hypothetical protein
MWVGGGDGTNKLGYSYDGINWTVLGGVFNTICQTVAWNGTLWLAGGSDNGDSKIASSYDGITWSTAATSLPIYNVLTLAWNGSVWIAGGPIAYGSNSLFYSSDGTNWTGIAGGLFSDGVGGLASRRVLPYVGTTQVSSNTPLLTENFTVAAGASTNTLVYSYDGIKWNATPGFNIFNAAFGVAWNGSLWLAGGSGSNTLAYSSDGINWTGLGNNVFTSNGGRFAWNGSIWVAVGGGSNTVAYSSDGINWTGLGYVFTNQGYDVAWNGSLWVAVGDGSDTIAYSSDGSNWTGNGNIFFTDIGFSVAWNGNFWVAGGSGSNSIGYSSDGSNWNGVASGGDLLSSVRGVAWNGSLWVAGGVGTSNTSAYSSDGSNWLGAGQSTINLSMNRISWNGSLWTAVGQGTSTNMVYSRDGSNWIGAGSILNEFGFGIASRRVLPYVGTSPAKSFVIDHPTSPSKYLVHACLEGPEAGVYYRGKSEVGADGNALVNLPSYVDAFATDLTVNVTPIYNGNVRTLNATEVCSNQFKVFGNPGPFHWHVYGKRQSIIVEPEKSNVELKGSGPYKWLV